MLSVIGHTDKSALEPTFMISVLHSSIKFTSLEPSLVDLCWPFSRCVWQLPQQDGLHHHLQPGQLDPAARQVVLQQHFRIQPHWQPHRLVKESICWSWVSGFVQEWVKNELVVDDKLRNGLFTKEMLHTQVVFNDIFTSAFLGYKRSETPGWKVQWMFCNEQCWVN